LVAFVARRLALAFFLALLVSASSSSEAPVRTQLEKFSKVLRLIRDDYVDSVDTHSVIVSGIQGMLANLDPHSDFLDEETYAKMTEEHRGSFFGVGMTISTQSGWLTVISPIEGTPAARSGILTGDRIVAVDTTSTEGLSSDRAAELIRGAKGTKVTLIIEREGHDGQLEFELIRDEIPIVSLPYAFFIRPGVAYLRLARFAKNSGQEMDEAIAELSEEGEIERIIFDLRGNSGGLLSSAVDVSDRFLEKDRLVVYTSGRISRSNQKETATQKSTWPEWAVVVLVDRGSASASEIVAGTGQDWDRGLVVGRTTFGEGLVQNVYELAGDNALKITTARYYTPSGRSIQRAYNGTRADYYRNAGRTEGNGLYPVAMSHGGRSLTGGGGIVPDVSVPPPRRLERVEVEAQRKGIVFEQASHELANNADLRDRFQSFDEFKSEFRIDQAMETNLREALEGSGVDISEEAWDQSKDFLLTGLRAEIAGHIWGPEERYIILIEQDDDIAKALEELDNAARLLEPGFLPGRPDSALPWPGEQLDIRDMT